MFMVSNKPPALQRCPVPRDPVSSMRDVTEANGPTHYPRTIRSITIISLCVLTKFADELVAARFWTCDPDVGRQGHLGSPGKKAPNQARESGG
jgi:hypothetical protein